MSLDVLRNKLVQRFDEFDRGDRGWFAITRVHVSSSWLKAIAEYIEYRSMGNPIEFDERDYQQLATIIETDNDNPGQQLRRHHLLVMDKPLRLLRRENGQSWQVISLTERGRALALADDPAEVLEEALTEIRFAVEPWSPTSRVEQYSEFDVQIYEATKRVLERTDGYIDRNEFDFFVSRIKRMSEVNWASRAISQYRELSEEQQQTLHELVRDRIPGDKAYYNWRDVALHTFSLFSLGTSMVRNRTHLFLTSRWADDFLISTRSGVSKIRIPDPASSEHLLVPPAAPASNDGSDAESFVAKVFRSQGWTVAFYTNRRGFGFDLWARKEDKAMVIEVKSSVGDLGSVNLTSVEYQAAIEHGENFALALVENLESEDPNLSIIMNPISSLKIVERQEATYSISRVEWLRVLSGEV
ncbi:DUF3883 domain-containing protein [Marinobacter sp. R17]|uniref:protein NO VEIN domain-containing protein n=1 Tax=Marinobacter sp. R17 TaxID=2484250 RepID=UPI000F4C1E17|nr:DUF3883 domain-containing protein [Marinobacter sp. R17]ROT99205.1 DUF3883 domain-containing protein [Marinobacter sp. R17]